MCPLNQTQEESIVSHLRMLFASAVAAVALAVFGPLFVGAVPAFAAGPVTPTNQQWSGGSWHHHYNPCDPDRDGDNDACHSHRYYNNYNNCFLPESYLCYGNSYYPCNCYNYVQPCYCYSYTQPVYYQPVVYQPVSYQPCYCQSGYTQPTYYWMNYGPSWNYGMPYSQVQSTCNAYNSAMGGNWYGYGYNQYVASVCISISYYGGQVNISVSP
jgi:hypothetical protein